LCARTHTVRFIENKNKEILRLNGVYKNMLGNAGVELINGFAKLVDAHTVEIDGKKVSFLPPLLCAPPLLRSYVCGRACKVGLGGGE